MMKINIVFFLLIILNTSANTIERKYDIICGTIPLSIGSCGKECEYEYNHNERSLTITGKKIDDYKSPLDVPWKSQMKRIVNITFNEIEHIGKNSFNGAKSLIELIIPSSVNSIGRNAFTNSNLKKIKYEGNKSLCENNIDAFEMFK